MAVTDEYEYDFDPNDWEECDMKMTEVASRMLVLAKLDMLPPVEDMAVILGVHTDRVFDALDGLRLMGYSFQGVDDDEWDEPIRVTCRPATIVQGHVEDPRVRELEKENDLLRLRLTNSESKASALERKVGEALAALERP